MVQRVGEALVAGEPGQYDASGAGGFGDGAGAGVVAAGFGVDEAVLVVAELGEHPSAEHDTEAGLAGDDVSVRVLAKTLAHLGLEGRGLLDHLGDHRDE